MTPMPGRYLSFDAVADEYDQTRVMPEEIAHDVARLCAATARLSEGGWFLDGGVGTGRLAAPLSRLHPGQIVGADISLPMMRHAQGKAARGSLALAQADLQRLPFRSGAFRGVLLVHILHLIEDWPAVLEETRRVLAPRVGVLLLGSEQGGRSALVDFYYERGRASGVLPSNLGVSGLPQTLSLLRRADRGGARIKQLFAPYLSWKRRVTAAQTLEALSRRTYSQMWTVPDEAHQSLLSQSEQYARRKFGELDTEEILTARFTLYAVRWP